MICNECKQDLPTTEFYKRDKTCKGCRSIKTKAYYERNKEKLKAYARAYREKNLEEVRKRQRQYYRKNADELNTKSRKRYKENLEERREYNRDYYYANHEALRAKDNEYKYLSRYGLTGDDYEKLLDKQDNKCAICGATESTGRSSKLYVDHDHETGEVRGLLCNHCNAGLGMFRDNIEALKAAVEYLEVLS